MNVGSFISTYYKHPIAIAIYIIVIAIIVYYVGKSMGGVKQSKLPNDTGWGGSLTEQDGKTIRNIVIRLHDDMDSYLVASGLRSRDNQAYYDLSNFSDTMFVAAYNDFNDLYFKEGNGTMKNWIDDELGLDGDVKKIIMQRFSKQNLK